MIRTLEAAWEFHQFLTDHEAPYVIIGGLAVQYWGRPRLTVDVDLTVLTPPEGAADFVQMIVKHFDSRVPDPVSFARQTRMILARASNGCEVDISLALPGYEDELIIHKAVAGRPQDLADIEGVVYRQGDTLDVEYIRPWLREFAAVLENPELIGRFEAPWRKLLAL